MADDAGHLGDVLLNLSPVRRAAETCLLQTQTEDRQRRAEFMRGIGDEPAFGIIGPGHAVKRGVDGGDQRPDLARQPVDGNARLRIPRPDTGGIARRVLQVPQGPAADQDDDADCRGGENQQDQDVLIGILDPVDIEMTSNAPLPSNGQANIAPPTPSANTSSMATTRRRRRLSRNLIPVRPYEGDSQCRATTRSTPPNPPPSGAAANARSPLPGRSG